MDAMRPRAAGSPGPRIPLALVLAFALLSWVLGPSPAVPAQAQQPEQPSFRLQLVVQSLTILDDREGRW